MFGWFKRSGQKPEVYEGEGIFLKCPDCDNYHRSPDIPSFDAAIRLACETVGATTQKSYSEYNCLSSDGRWDMLPEEGIFCFTNSDGRRCFADFSLVGSWIEATHSWMWGWNLPDTHITPANRKASDLARAKGEAEGWPCLTTPSLLLNADEAWHLTDLAAFLAGYPMVYRAKVNEKAWAYFAIDQLAWET
ncbi:hypothetical protein SLH47_16090 [Cognatiyoonia sp. IB215182]|nr:hypothetical protein [Cognatiyoonia sp. IB215182]